MEISAAWLLTIFLAVAAITIDAVPTSTQPTTEIVRVSEVNATAVESTKTTPKDNFIDYARPFTNMKDILMQEIQTLDKDTLDKDDDKVSDFLLHGVYCVSIIFLIL